MKLEGLTYQDLKGQQVQQRAKESLSTVKTKLAANKDHWKDKITEINPGNRSMSSKEYPEGSINKRLRDN